MKAQINVSVSNKPGEVEFDIELPWDSLWPIGSTIRIDSRESDGSNCVFLNITGYDLYANVVRTGEAKMTDQVTIFTEFDRGRSSHTLEELRQWFELD